MPGDGQRPREPFSSESPLALGAAAALAASAVVGGVLAAALLSIYRERLPAFANVAETIAERRPYTIALQSRLLEPLLLRVGSAVSGSDWTQVFAVELGLLCVAVMLGTTVAFRRYCGSWRTGVAYALFLAVALVVVHDRAWLHLWDLVDVLVATAFGYAVFTEANLGAFMALFAVALVNRESALFIPLWVALSALPSRVASRGFRLGRFVAGTSAIAFGLLLLFVVRTSLYEGEPTPRRRPTTPWGNHVTLHHNANDFVRAVETASARPLLVYATIVIVLVLVARVRPRLPPGASRFPLFLGMMTALTCTSSVVLETRTWFFFLPLLGFCHAASAFKEIRGGESSISRSDSG